MADAAIGFLTEAVLSKVISLAADELSLSFGVKKELTKLAKKLEMIQALLSDAESKQLSKQVVKLWLEKLKSIALDAQIVLDDFGYQVLCQKIKPHRKDKVHRFFSHSSPVYFRSKMGHKIRDVLSSLEEVYAESTRLGLTPVGLIESLPNHNNTNRLTDPFMEDSEIVGRDDDASEVIRMLVGTDYGKALPVITILGMGGQGKTTLAKLVYNNEKVKTYFDIRVWVCVSDNFIVEELLARIWESLSQTTCQLSGREALVNKLSEQLSNKRYLLVFDDVWNKDEDECDVMRKCLLAIGGSKGSKIMTTTRSEEVASALRTSECYRLKILSEQASFALFEKCAFSEGGVKKTPELVAIAKRILKRCGGIPLAIKAIAGSLYSNNSESEWSMIERSELWNVPNTGGGGVLSAIRLSYDHLPSRSLKQCFAYCGLFHKDAIFEKDKMVQLWMAQGYLNPPKGSHLQMEDVGNLYFNILLKSSLLQDARKDIYNNIIECKMHDIVHDFSLQVLRGYSFDMKDAKDGMYETEAMHLSIINYKGGIPEGLKGVISSKLRTLNLEYDVGVKLGDWFVNFRYLTVLTIGIPGANELPEAISKITHLRYLDVCYFWRSRLPKSFMKLYYLQTLRVRYLDELPEGFGNLINLRHLYMRRRYRGMLIPGLGKLTNLQTLPFLTVGKFSGREIEDLAHLNNLKGKLRLFCLQNVRSYESALKSNMSMKSDIHNLKLYWDKREHDCDDADVMEGLKPHSSLKGLKIVGYQSPNFPCWMVARNNNLMVLRNLVKITLDGTDKCQRLPSLGDLPCLEFLEIVGLQNVKCIDKEFYGWSNLDWVKENSYKITPFPALKVLVLRDMNSLEEWSDAGIPTNLMVNAFPLLENIELMELSKLSVFPNLGSLPCLQQLCVFRCTKMTIQSSWNRLVSQKFEPDEGTTLIHSSVGADVHYLQSLRDLRISKCDNFLAPFCSLEILAPLKSLYINNNPRLWPKNLHNLVNLESLELRPSLHEEIDYFPWPYTQSHVGFRHFVSLTSLSLFGWSKVTSLPHQIQYATALRSLALRNFSGFEALPEWLGDLKCLQQLIIWRCTNLKHFPSVKASRQLTNLQDLRISECPLLKERCAKECGPEWPKIAHIPAIKFDPTWK